MEYTQNARQDRQKKAKIKSKSAAKYLTWWKFLGRAFCGISTLPGDKMLLGCAHMASDKMEQVAPNPLKIPSYMGFMEKPGIEG